MKSERILNVSRPFSAYTGHWPVRLRFSSRVGYIVSDKTWHPTQRTWCNADGSLEMEFEVKDFNDIKWWILGYGDQVRIVGPEQLREIVAEIAGMGSVQEKTESNPAY